MKKSIVLLITLLFIASISVLILKNLEDTNTYVEESHYKLNKIQVIRSIKNIQVEISKLLVKNKEHIDDVIEEVEENYIPISVEDILLEFKIKKYDRYDINLLKSEDRDKYKKIEELFEEYDIYEFDRFRDHFKTHMREKNYSSLSKNKQKQDVINSFIKKTDDNNILKVEDRLSFFDNSKKKKLYELFVKVNYFSDFTKAYYILDEEGVVKYFESSFK